MKEIECLGQFEGDQSDPDFAGDERLVPNDTPEWIMQTIQDDSQRDLGPAIVLEIRGS